VQIRAQLISLDRSASERIITMRIRELQIEAEMSQAQSLEPFDFFRGERLAMAGGL
jgi:hypothetical protein